MYIEITNSGFKVIGKEPLKLNLKQLGIESFSFAISGLKYPIPNKKDTLFETIKINLLFSIQFLFYISSKIFIDNNSLFPNYLLKHLLFL